VSAWLTPDAVATYLGDPALATDPNLASVCDGLAAYLERLRPDVFTPALGLLVQMSADVPRADPVVPADLILGATLWAAHVFQLRSGPAGFAGYGDGAGDAMFDLSYASNRSDIWRLCGIKRPVAW